MTSRARFFSQTGRWLPLRHTERCRMRRKCCQEDIQETSMLKRLVHHSTWWCELEYRTWARSACFVQKGAKTDGQIHLKRILEDTVIHWNKENAKDIDLTLLPTRKGHQTTMQTRYVIRKNVKNQYSGLPDEGRQAFELADLSPFAIWSQKLVLSDTGHWTRWKELWWRYKTKFWRK